MAVNFGPVVTEHKSVGSEKVIADAKKMAKVFGELGKAEKKVSDNARRLQNRQETVNKVMRGTGVSAKNARAAVAAYGRSVGKAEKEVLAMARALDAAEKEQKQLAAAQRRGTAGAGFMTKAFKGFALQLVAVAAAGVTVQAALRGIASSVGSLKTLEDELLGAKAAALPHLLNQSLRSPSRSNVVSSCDMSRRR